MRGTIIQWVRTPSGDVLRRVIAGSCSWIIALHPYFFYFFEHVFLPHYPTLLFRPYSFHSVYEEAIFLFRHDNKRKCLRQYSRYPFSYYLSSACNPGSVPFSISSSIAPPPVEIWVILSRYSFLEIADSVSPPPTIDIAPVL